MSQQKVEGFGKVEVAAEHQPNCQRGGGGDDGGKPGAENRRHLGGDQRRNAIRQLHQKTQRAGFFFAAEGANGHEGKQERDGDVERAECRHQDAVERDEAARQHGRIARGGARFAVERGRLEKAVAHERAQDQQHGPKRAPARDLPQLLGEQRMEWGAPNDGWVR